MRKLNNVRKLWEGILDVREIKDVFTGEPVVLRQYDVDHFIPHFLSDLQKISLLCIS